MCSPTMAVTTFLLTQNKCSINEWINGSLSLLLVPFWEPLSTKLALRYQLMLTNRRSPRSHGVIGALCHWSREGWGRGRGSLERKERDWWWFLDHCSHRLTLPFYKSHQTSYYLLNIAFSTRSYLFNVLFSFLYNMSHGGKDYVFFTYYYIPNT